MRGMFQGGLVAATDVLSESGSVYGGSPSRVRSRAPPGRAAQMQREPPGPPTSTAAGAQVHRTSRSRGRKALGSGPLRSTASAGPSRRTSIRQRGGEGDELFCDTFEW